jgi:ribosomal protein S24E
VLEAELLYSRDNKLLGRKELVYLFKDAAGSLTRKDAIEYVASQLSVSPENVVLVKLEGLFGKRDVQGKFYVYSDSEEARRQLPEYLFLRNLSKEERAKILEEKRKAKAAARRR